MRRPQEVLPDGVVTDLTGQARELRDSSSNLALVFVLALAFIYLVLSAQFESFRDPVMIMFSVPLSMTGALAALYFTGGTLERLFADRAGDAHRADHQARHPDR